MFRFFIKLFMSVAIFRSVEVFSFGLFFSDMLVLDGVKVKSLGKEKRVIRIYYFGFIKFYFII